MHSKLFFLMCFKFKKIINNKLDFFERLSFSNNYFIKKKIYLYFLNKHSTEIGVFEKIY